MTRNELTILESARCQRRLVMQMKQQLCLKESEIRGMRLDGMPGRSGGMRTGLERQMIRREMMEDMLKRESRREADCEEAARAVLSRLPERYYTVCVLYYIAGMSVADTAETMEMSERAVWRLLSRIRNGLTGEDEAGAAKGTETD